MACLPPRFFLRLAGAECNSAIPPKPHSFAVRQPQSDRVPGMLVARRQPWRAFLRGSSSGWLAQSATLRFPPSRTALLCASPPWAFLRRDAPTGYRGRW